MAQARPSAPSAAAATFSPNSTAKPRRFVVPCRVRGWKRDSVEPSTLARIRGAAARLRRKLAQREAQRNAASSACGGTRKLLSRRGGEEAGREKNQEKPRKEAAEQVCRRCTRETGRRGELSTGWWLRKCVHIFSANGRRAAGGSLNGSSYHMIVARHVRGAALTVPTKASDTTHFVRISYGAYRSAQPVPRDSVPCIRRRGAFAQFARSAAQPGLRASRFAATTSSPSSQRAPLGCARGECRARVAARPSARSGPMR